MTFSEFHTIDYILLGALLLLFLVQMYFYIRYMAAPSRKLRRDSKLPLTNHKSEIINQKSEITEGVSVLLSAHNESYNLSQYLQALLLQDYPTFEVIVIDDGSEDSTRDVVENYMLTDPRVRMTFVPYGARVRSTKKLALTLGAKAAQYDYLLLTDADCVPESPHWISQMMSGFEGSTEIVLGFGAYFTERKHLNRLIQFDTLFNGLHYLGAALCGHPYMGVGRNLAYKKSLFFESGGFSHLMTTRAGDDDLFVNHVATRTNTAVVLTRDSLTWSPAKSSFKEWWQQKRRHLSVSPQYRTSTKFRLALEPLTRGLFYTLVIGIVAWQLMEMNGLLSIVHCPLSIPLLAAIGLFLLRWFIQTLILNISARRLGLKRFCLLSILWFDIALPLVNLWMLCVPRKYKW